MKFLIDTHVLIWWDDEYQKLSSTVHDALTNPENAIYLSLVSIWEMQIKTQLGKLKFSVPLREKISTQIQRNNLLLLSITNEHIYALDNLASYHRDPFDRLLIAQAQHEKMTLVTHDKAIQQYDVDTLW